ncbi:MAG TPA: DUF1800 domain-containing protein [Candidatus Limnocylindria bacterium]|nr:DUF1800 domain-containing protein [Candidatus Limnocylindria bacterium]
MAASTTSPSASYRPAGTLDAAAALQPYAGPWNARLAAHLARRAGFGGSPADVAQLAATTMNGAVDRFIRFADTSALPPPPALEPPQFPRRALRGQPAPNAEERMAAMKAKRLSRRRNLIALQTWWLERMIASPAPLQEKMTLFWHGHFTSAINEKNVTAQMMLAQNQLFRRNALGDVRALTLAVSQDPAMLRYLDNSVNVKAHPNENYARELMELFTLGIGNYTERDVRESARAFTGWTYRLDRETGYGTFVADDRRHDDGVKTFLGRSGAFDGADIVRIIFEQPAAPRFLATKLLAFFVYQDPEPELVDQVAALIVRKGFVLQTVLSTLLRSQVFYSDRAYRALVKSPVEFVVGTHQLFGSPQVVPFELATLRSMGQVLFYPPNVKGWDGGAAWINSQTVLTRENFANAIAQSPAMLTDAPWLSSAARTMDPRNVARTLTTTMLQGDVSPAADAQLISYLDGDGQSTLSALSVENADERVRRAAYLTMAMPAYQLA